MREGRGADGVEGVRNGGGGIDGGGVGEPGEDGYEEAKAAGVYEVLELERDLTTMDVVERILENKEKYEQRNSKRAGQEKDYLQHKEYVAELPNRVG